MCFTVHERPPALRDHSPLHSLYRRSNVCGLHLFKQELASDNYNTFPMREKQQNKRLVQECSSSDSKACTFLYIDQVIHVVKNA